MCQLPNMYMGSSTKNVLKLGRDVFENSDEGNGVVCENPDVRKLGFILCAY